MRGAAFTLGWLLGIIGLIAHSAVAARQSSKGATIELRAKWPSTPLVMEAAEFLVTSCRLPCTQIPLPSPMHPAHSSCCSEPPHRSPALLQRAHGWILRDACGVFVSSEHTTERAACKCAISTCPHVVSCSRSICSTQQLDFRPAKSARPDACEHISQLTCGSSASPASAAYFNSVGPRRLHTADPAWCYTRHDRNPNKYPERRPRRASARFGTSWSRGACATAARSPAGASCSGSPASACRPPWRRCTAQGLEHAKHQVRLEVNTRVRLQQNPV